MSADSGLRSTPHVTPPYSDPGEPVEFEHTTAGRRSCPSCGEWVYPQRPIGLQRGFAFPPNCPVCGASTSEAIDE